MFNLNIFLTFFSDIGGSSGGRRGTWCGGVGVRGGGEAEGRAAGSGGAHVSRKKECVG